MSSPRTDVEPRWPVLLALAVVVALHFALPEVLSLGPSWLLGAAFAVLSTLVSVFHSRGSEGKAYVVGLILMVAVTAALVASVVLLIRSLLTHTVVPLHLLQSADSL